MLESFEITEVNIPNQHMDSEREIDLVLVMVEAHNSQVEIEAKGGSMPRSRPETEGYRIWDPYETYIPQLRTRIEIAPVVQYTGVVFSEGIQSFLRRIARMEQGKDLGIKPPPIIQNQDLDQWDIPDDFHITLCMGVVPEEFLKATGGLGATVLVELEAVGELEGKIWALKAKGVDSLTDIKNAILIAPNGNMYATPEPFKHGFKASSNETSTAWDLDLQGELGRVMLRKDGTPHIMMAYDRFRGMRPYAATKIRQWEPLGSSSRAPRVILVGTIGVKKLLGMKSQKLDQLAIVPGAGVCIANIIKLYASKKEISLHGRELGLMIKKVRQEMKRLVIENKAANEE
ncbi:hypothetical protein BGZ65_009672 [Modicella reniformis]|uniref:Uncharacterized protein n=1 Tax=Modicella reniformis TaxID=1440133 RepID=A0A9P6INF7_9FUNG|nr:hypothetical protein BGZ65_009672 [Modicella reniformis]